MAYIIKINDSKKNQPTKQGETRKPKNKTKQRSHSMIEVDWYRSNYSNYFMKNIKNVTAGLHKDSIKRLQTQIRKWTEIFRYLTFLGSKNETKLTNGKMIIAQFSVLECKTVLF